jgi:hypothetical protein
MKESCAPLYSEQQRGCCGGDDSNNCAARATASVNAAAVLSAVAR